MTAATQQTVTGETPTIHLIGCGDMIGIYSRDVQPGMHLMWNYGSVYEVIEVRDKSAKFIEVVERSTESGTSYTRRLKKDRIVCGYWPKAK